LRWTAPDLDEEAQAEHPRICSDSSPAQAIPRIFLQYTYQGRVPRHGLPLPEVIIHLKKRDHAADS